MVGGAIVILALAATVSSLKLADAGPERSRRAQVSTPVAEHEAGSQGQAGQPAKPQQREMPRPVHIAIPAIGVSARVVPLGLNPDRTLEVPTNISDTGWFTEGPEPGERGAAVIVGHVDSRSGPGVFYRLRDLRPGEVIRIRLGNGTFVRYRVRSEIVVPKTRFPTKRVYARTRRPTLRLITCSGELNPSTGRHPDNRIVFASLLGVA